MNARSHALAHVLTLAGGVLLIAAGASAQDQGNATTRSLNTGPAQSVMTPRPNAQPPLATPPQAKPPQARPAPPPSRTLEDLLGETDTPDDAGPTTDEAPTEGVILAEGETEPEPIPLALGYYARGDTDCAQVWPGDGDLAFATPTSFTIDFGGCEPGQWLQTGPNRWREDQRCQTELGGDAGAYSITYEVVDAGTLKRTARLAIDGSVEEDQWKHCEADTVPENARFASDGDTGSTQDDG